MRTASIIAMHHSTRYQAELDGESTAEAAELGQRALALIRAGKATYADFLGQSLDAIRDIVTSRETGLFWLGQRDEGDFICYQADKPVKIWRGYRFTHAVGPFLSRLGATYYARYGHKNPDIRSPADAERWAREDDDPLWVVLRESIEANLTLTPDEIADCLQVEAEEYEPDRPRLTFDEIAEMHQASQSLAERLQEI